MKICLVTSYAAAAEPRGPRHAISARRAFPDAEVTLVDISAAGATRPAEPELLLSEGIARQTMEFPTRASGLPSLVVRKLNTHLRRAAFLSVGVIDEGVFGDRTQGLTRALTAISADVYFAHNIETLQPALSAARVHGASVVFDCMEFYSDMGDGQHPVVAAAAHALEAANLSRCALVIASSDTMADALAAEYGIARPLPAYNVPPTAAILPERRGSGLNLYWRNSVIGFGQRGLQDVLEALPLVPSDVHLHLQGRLPDGNAAELTQWVTALKLADRVHVLPPYAPHEAVQQAARYDVGLCLERRGPRNHDLTVSNKMFDYHMAGLAVIATDLPALAAVVHRSGGGVVCQPGDPSSLADTIRRFHSSRALLEAHQVKARAFALAEGNLEVEIEKISAALKAALGEGRRRL